MSTVTKKQIREFAQKSDSKLTKACLAIALNYVSKDDYETFEDFVNSLLQHGCQSGMIGALIYYHDTCAFYRKHQKEINAMLYNTLQECGCSASELFRDKWDNEDPLCIEDMNQNLLAWFAFEETCRNVAYSFDLDV